MFTKKYKRLLMVSGLGLIGTLTFANETMAYEVKKGDTLYEIAQSHNISLDTIIKLNTNIENPNLIYIGDIVKTDINGVVAPTNVINKEVNNKVYVETNVNVNDKELLARLVEAEAGAESYAGKVAVAEVVLNRVDNNQFPDSVQGVIYQKRQFTPVSNGSINNTPSGDSVRAVNEAMANRTDRTSLYFYNSSVATSRWLDNLTTTKVIGSHTFKK